MKNKNGITLITLVITIGILLGLVGIVVKLVTGDNGIIQKVTTSEIEYTKVEVSEILTNEINNQRVKAASKIVENKEDISSKFNEKELIAFLSGETDDAENPGIGCLSVEPTAKTVKTVQEDAEISTIYVVNPVKLSDDLTNCGKGKKIADKDVFTLEVVAQEIKPEDSEETYFKSTGKFELKYYDNEGNVDVVETLTLYETNKS